MLTVDPTPRIKDNKNNPRRDKPEITGGNAPSSPRLHIPQNTPEQRLPSNSDDSQQSAMSFLALLGGASTFALYYFAFSILAVI